MGAALGCYRTSRSSRPPHLDGREPGVEGDSESSCPHPPCFEKRDAQYDVRWKYVGHGRGGYDIVQDYNFVGPGIGSFEREARIPDRRSGVLQLVIGFAVGVVVVVLVYFLVTRLAGRSPHAESDSVVPSDVVSRSRSTAPPSVYSTSALAPRSTSQAPASVAVTTPFSYDCAASKTNWAGGWSIQKRHWCCQHEGVRCPEPEIHQVVVQQTIRKEPSAKSPCDTVCKLDGMSATCKARIQWAASHRYSAKQNACYDAHKMVQERCPSCSSCALIASGCKASAKPTPPPPLWHDCMADFVKWETRWSSEKKTWCCSHYKRGCG